MRNSWRALVAITTGTFMITLDGAAVQLALPEMQRRLGATVVEAQWAMTGFLLLTAAALLPGGRLGDIYGRDRCWRAGMTVFAVGSALCAAAPEIWILVAARGLQGLGAGLVTANSAPLILDTFDEHRRGKALGLGNISIALGLVLGPPLGGIVTGLVSWRLIFAVSCPVALMGLMGARRVLPKPPRTRASVDWLGAALSTVGLTSVLVASTFGRRWGWTSPTTMSAALTGIMALALFGMQQRQVEHPLVEWKLFLRRSFMAGAFAALFGFAALFSLTFSMPFFLLAGQTRGLVEAGLIAGVVPVGVALVAPPSAMWTERIGARIICTAGLGTIAVALVLMQMVGPGSGFRMLALSLFLAGAGTGAFEASNNLSVLSGLPNKSTGVGMGALGVMRNLGMTLGVALSGTIVDHVLLSSSGPQHQRATEGVHAALLVAAVMALIGALFSTMRPSPQEIWQEREAN